MPKTKSQKQAIAAGLGEKLDKNPALVFVDYRGLAVPKMEALRGELQTGNAKLQVAKKTLLAKALQEKGIGMDVKNLLGELAVVFSFGDPMTALKSVSSFAKKEGNLKVLGGYVDSQALEAADVLRIAELPSKDQLIAQVVGTMAAPLSGFLRVLQGNIQGLVVALQAIQDKKS